MIKIVWYIISLITICSILLSSPNSFYGNDLINRNSLLKMSPNQNLLNKIIMVNILLFFLFTIISVNLFIS